MKKKRYYGSKSSMMPSSEGSFANMYQSSFVKPFPMTAYISDGTYPDTLAEIDAQKSKNVNGLQRIKSNKKY